MALRLRGATSGYIELKAPASAGDNTLTLPTNNGSANQLLKTDGSGNLSWTDDNSGVSLSGSTDNTIATVTGANALIGEANLTFDGTQLVVQGGTGTQHLFKHSAGWGGITSAGSAGGSGAGFSLANNYSGTLETKWSIYLDGATDDLRFTANTPDQTGDEKLRITSDGKVGIGTTSPTELLDVEGTIECLNELRSKTGNDLKLNAGSANRDVFLQVNDSTLMTVQGSTGKVGIGTTSPVGGDFVVENTSGTAAIALSRVFSGNVASSAVNTPSFAFTMSDTATNDQVVASVSPQALAGTGDAFKGHIRIFTANDAGTNTERLRIENNGNVTIQDGDLVVANTHGIDFSANGGPASGTGGSELLDDYEEGTFSPGWFDDGGNFVTSYSTQYGQYTKIGNVVYFCFGLRIGTFSRTPNADQICRVGNLPYASRTVADDEEVGFTLYARLWGSGTPPKHACVRQATDSNHVDFYMEESQAGNDHILRGEDFDSSATCRVIVSGFYYTS